MIAESNKGVPAVVKPRPLLTFEVSKSDWKQYKRATGYSKTLLHIEMFYTRPKRYPQEHYGPNPPNGATNGISPWVRVTHPIPLSVPLREAR